MTHFRASRGCATLLLLGIATGCQSTLEDGYKPRALNANAAQRRAYYASPFTPEAAAGDQDKSGALGRSHRPGAY